MSRRDTIIIAVLINVGLLTILFATARNMDAQAVASAEPPKPVQSEERRVVAVTTPSRTAQPQATARDEVDRVLANYQTRQETPTSTPPAPPQAQAVEEDREFADVAVKRGDSLDKIARSNNTTVETLMAVNRLHSTRLSIGQVLKVPLSDHDGEIADSGRAETRAPEPRFYVVQAGDNPWVIARRNNIQLEELLRLNDLDEAKARRLRPGDKLRIE